MRTAELDYDLPDRLIAQHPAPTRDRSRLLVVDRQSGAFTDGLFFELPARLDSGDCLVLNDTRVIRARLLATKPTGGRVEILLLRECGPGVWRALVRPSARVKKGTIVTIADSLRAEIGEPAGEGTRAVRFERHDVLSMLETAGLVPLPPYIRRDQTEPADAERYQTVYASQPGAVAAPTAGLHFTPEVFARLDAAGVRRACLTLHVGYGTFRPVQTERIEEHRVEAEAFNLPAETALALNDTRTSGRRIVAVGTTSARVLETRFTGGAFRPGEGTTRLGIFPPYKFRGVDALLTNFHLPRSSLLALVCAFAGKDLTLGAYRHAIDREYRFFSYGDAMLIL
jgi:S-adenosylmethionine:tRNA ribosyltransferase-isomerase